MEKAENITDALSQLFGIILWAILMNYYPQTIIGISLVGIGINLRTIADYIQELKAKS